MHNLVITLALIVVIACGVKYLITTTPGLMRRQQQHRHKDLYHDTDLTMEEYETISEIRTECAKTTMVPIFNPFFNARRILLELLLLQHHLEEPGMLCKECIGRKHMLIVEGYALEAIGLVKSEVAEQPEYKTLCKDMEDVIVVMRKLHEMFMAVAPMPKDDPNRKLIIAKVARSIRALRKELSPRYAVMPPPDAPSASAALV